MKMPDRSTITVDALAWEALSLNPLRLYSMFSILVTLPRTFVKVGQGLRAGQSGDELGDCPS